MASRDCSKHYRGGRALTARLELVRAIRAAFGLQVPVLREEPHPHNSLLPADYMEADWRPILGDLRPGDPAPWGTYQPVCTLDQATPECHIRNQKGPRSWLYLHIWSA